jgi:hypothetical protein
MFSDMRVPDPYVPRAGRLPQASRHALHVAETMPEREFEANQPISGAKPVRLYGHVMTMGQEVPGKFCRQRPAITNR